jgi:hypothetical protein
LQDCWATMEAAMTKQLTSCRAGLLRSGYALQERHGGLADLYLIQQGGCWCWMDVAGSFSIRHVVVALTGLSNSCVQAEQAYALQAWCGFC